jgi:hypothetical protein
MFASKDDSSPLGNVGVFFGIAERPNDYDLETCWRGEHPEGLLPIADAASGQVCIALAGPNRGAVLFWLTDVMEGEFEDPHAALELLANNFDHFMNGLVPE